MKEYTIWYSDKIPAGWIHAEKLEDDGENIVFYVPKKYIARTEKGRYEVLPLQRTGDE